MFWCNHEVWLPILTAINWKFEMALMFFSCPQVSDLTCHCEALPSNQQCGRTHRRTQGPATLGTGPGSRRHTLVVARVACVSSMHIPVRRKRIAVSWPPPEWGKANTLCMGVYLAQAPLNFWVRHWHLPYSTLDRVIKRWNHKLGGRIEVDNIARAKSDIESFDREFRICDWRACVQAVH